MSKTSFEFTFLLRFLVSSFMHGLGIGEEFRFS